MKNIKEILVITLAVGIGLAVGYLIFGNNTEEAGSNHPMDASEPSMAATEEIWTCSMDPQVRQNEPGDCPICGMDLILLEANTSNDPLVLEMTASAVKLAGIQTNFIGKNQGSVQSIRLSGKIQVDERLISSQVAHIPGRIEQLFVTFTGEQVRKGQKIASVYSPDLIAAQRELLEAMKLEDVNPTLVQAARNKLRFWKIAEATLQNIEQKGVVQETFDIYADESGVVMNKRVSVGDHLRKGEPLFELVSLSNVWVLFDAYEKDLSLIKLGDIIEFSTPSIPNKIFRTPITFIDPVINPSTRVASLRTEIRNIGGQLKPEMFVNGTLQRANNTDAPISIPKSAVLWTGKRSVVYVKVQDSEIPSYQYREVELGDGLGDHYQILKGLEIGEEVVTNGAFVIDAAAQLNNQSSMMNKHVEVKQNNTIEPLPNFEQETSAAFKQQLASVFEKYLELKDALVLTDSKEAILAAKEIDENLLAIDTTLLEGEAHAFWEEQLISLKYHNEKLRESDDVEEQRKQFDSLSQLFIKLVKVFGIANSKLYIQHCPMAFDNAGADWISTEELVQNPYFGDKMLKCGTVKSIIEP